MIPSLESYWFSDIPNFSSLVPLHPPTAFNPIYLVSFHHQNSLRRQYLRDCHLAFSCFTLMENVGSGVRGLDMIYSISLDVTSTMTIMMMLSNDSHQTAFNFCEYQTGIADQLIQSTVNRCNSGQWTLTVGAM